MSTRAYIAAQLLNAGFFALSSCLIIACLRELAGAKAHWPRQRQALIAYVATMGGLSFVAIAYDSLRFVAFVQYLTDILYHHASNNPVPYFEDDMLRPILPVALWGAVGFMTWRLYEHVRPTEKFGFFMVGCLTIALLALSIASSIPVFSYAPPSHQYGEFLFAYRFFSFAAAIVNITISVIIAARLVFWDRVFDVIERSWRSYGRVLIHILIASGGLLTLCAILAASFFKIWVHDYMVIPVFVMPQISTISTLLIVYVISKQAEKGVIRLEDTAVPDDAIPASA
ncbi:hypothetical protein D9619_012069 [Psilocybe cf. subviscida]|uniref:Uncharacterized protein n=1 Tax=Psilocybe cf. subviscida TaxID=2480587 RepID=A0A8H5B7K4_9AGAR|nr:hypothetical protein D9619_012069 [Psilocybe cf. subviscida]